MCTLNGSLTHIWFVTPKVGHWGNTDSMSYAGFVNIDTFYYTAVTITFINITIDFYQEIL